MNANELQVETHEIQAAIYAAALSLDSLLINGIPYGVLQQPLFGDFLQKRADNLLMDLAKLEGLCAAVSVPNQSRVATILAELRARCQELIAILNELRSFRSLPFEQVQSSLSLIPPIREGCVQLIQELEGCLGTPEPFYQSRPAHSTAMVADFLANLEQVFANERDREVRDATD